ncbi:hypothetical protein GCM10012290_18480 [Halolactibacillus alkaliphilus]|uniref:Uncharacterized protein n=1 Tax=Halolactibacillus alkaliphilus TaxID=442899 RepID=A0A511X2W7_9BACI|nr:hypothetical protein HAL01_17480 [Halolactibacillus alkaliphilus]GGN72467.1 hypothetical protein GCM10012290_18480 [Halolactibacillus alkaliphilus]
MNNYFILSTLLKYAIAYIFNTDRNIKQAFFKRKWGFNRTILTMYVIIDVGILGG